VKELCKYSEAGGFVFDRRSRYSVFAITQALSRRQNFSVSLQQRVAASGRPRAGFLLAFKDCCGAGGKDAQRNWKGRQIMSANLLSHGCFRAVLILDGHSTARIYTYEVGQAEGPGEALYSAVSFWKSVVRDEPDSNPHGMVYVYRYGVRSKGPQDVVSYLCSFAGADSVAGSPGALGQAAHRGGS
jgi:hypothetical protein